jgi:hypothetical protein
MKKAPDQSRGPLYTYEDYSLFNVYYFLFSFAPCHIIYIQYRTMPKAGGHPKIAPPYQNQSLPNGFQLLELKMGG